MADELDLILKEKYTTSFRPYYSWHDGLFMLGNFTKHRNEIRDFQVRDDDVWVTSFPKAGTTWTQEMVWLISNDLDYEGAKKLLNYRFPYIELNCIFDSENFENLHPDIKCEEFLSNPIGLLDNMKGRRFIKSHLPWRFLPIQLQNGASNAKIIHVMRNPKDVCVSYHHHSGAVEGGRGTLDDFFKLFMAGKVVCGPFWDNVLSYWERRHLPNLLIIKYEDMKRDLPSVIRKVAEFLGKNVRDEQMDGLVKHLSFEEMKRNKAVNFEPLIEFLKEFLGDRYESDGIFMRSGVVGSHKTQMTEEMVNLMDRWIEENTAGTDLIL